MDYNELIEAFAASLGIEGVAADGDAAAFEIDGMRVEIFHDQPSDAVMVCGEIGLPSPGDEKPVAAAMLKANHLFAGTAGATLSQNPETGAYAIFQSFPLAAMDAHALAEKVAQIADKTEHWRNILDAFELAESEKGAAAANEAPVDAFLGGSGFMQV